MKKVIMCMAVAVVAACANAASFQWSAANIFNGDAKASDVTGYLLFADQLSVADATSALKAGKLTSVTGAAASSFAITTGAVTASKTVFDRSDAVNNQDYDAYYVLISSDESTYFISDTRTATAVDVGTATFSFGNQQNATKGVAWTKVGGVTPPGPDPVPEPTSGLLLVLGGAALALRRKQK